MSIKENLFNFIHKITYLITLISIAFYVHTFVYTTLFALKVFHFLNYWLKIFCYKMWTRPGRFQFLPLCITVKSGKQWKCPGLGPTWIQFKKRSNLNSDSIDSKKTLHTFLGEISNLSATAKFEVKFLCKKNLLKFDLVKKNYIWPLQKSNLCVYFLNIISWKFIH